ncbi:MAG: hypothetical protein HY719_00590 [Planctomycetes bacterium]|nr:hypothetical protein [Planctomycetota bacterium]
MRLEVRAEVRGSQVSSVSIATPHAERALEALDMSRYNLRRPEKREGSIAMRLRGHVRNGVIELDHDARLPEGAEVEVSLLAPEDASDDSGTTLFERLLPVIGKAQGLPPDASKNVDHYLYGLPKT